jgi:hypothetical protein
MARRCDRRPGGAPAGGRFVYSALPTKTEAWFRQTRLHSSIGNVPPIEYETVYCRHIDPQQQPLPGELSLY